MKKIVLFFILLGSCSINIDDDLTNDEIKKYVPTELYDIGSPIGTRIYDQYEIKKTEEELRESEYFAKLINDYYLLLINDYKQEKRKIDDYNIFGETLLMMAAFYGDIDIMSELINKGANVYIKRKDLNGNASDYARIGTNWEACKLLGNKKTFMHASFRGLLRYKDIKTDIPKKLFSNKTLIEVEKELLGKGTYFFDIIINYKSCKFYSGDYQKMIKSYYDEVIDNIKNNKVVIHTRSVWGETPLQMASFFGDIDTIEYLLDKGVDINDLNDPHNDIWAPSKSNNENALHYAAKGRQKEAYNLLIKKGINVSQKNVEGKTPAECWGVNQ